MQTNPLKRARTRTNKQAAAKPSEYTRTAGQAKTGTNMQTKGRERARTRNKQVVGPARANTGEHMRRGQAYAQNQAGTNERQDKRTSANKQVAGTSTNRLEPAQPSRDQESGPSASEHTTARAQTRWYEHEQGQERGERRRARGRASERNAAASGIENNSGGYNKCGGSDSRNGSSRSGAGAGAGTAAAGQGGEREHREQREREREHQRLQGWHLQQEQGFYVPPSPLLFFFFFFFFL